MPVNWDKLEDEMDDIIDKTDEKVEDALAARISAVTRMTEDEIKELFPDSSDEKKLARLLSVVNGATSRNEKVNSIVENVEEFAGIIVSLIQKFV